MKTKFSRRSFLGTAAVASAGVAVPKIVRAATPKETKEFLSPRPPLAATRCPSPRDRRLLQEANEIYELHAHEQLVAREARPLAESGRSICYIYLRGAKYGYRVSSVVIYRDMYISLSGRFEELCCKQRKDPYRVIKKMGCEPSTYPIGDDTANLHPDAGVYPVFSVYDYVNPNRISEAGGRTTVEPYVDLRDACYDAVRCADEAVRSGWERS